MRQGRYTLIPLVVAAALAGSALVLQSALPGAPPYPANAQGSSCSFVLNKTAAPATIQLGAEVTVTLQVGGTCPEQDRPADVILVIDRSTSMQRDGKLDAAKQAATTFVDSVDPTLVHVGIVAVGPYPVRIQSLTGDQAVLRAAIAGIGGTRGTNIVDALAMAKDDLAGPDSRPGVAKAIVFLTDGNHNTGPDISDIYPILDALRAASVEVFAIALGNDADEALLQQMASSPSHYYKSPTTAELQGIYQQIAGRIKATTLIKTATIVDQVPSNMRYIPGSGAPVQPSVSTDGRTLTWNLVDINESGTTLSYRVRPLQSGKWPTNVKAELAGKDGYDQPFDLLFPVPSVTINNPPPEICYCAILYQPWRVRQADRTLILATAKSNPGAYYGWNLLLDGGKPGAPPFPVPGYNRGPNPRRTCLDLVNQNVPYHPLYNPPVWRAGCLSGVQAGASDTLGN
jgi:hypothetical protein